MDNGQMVKRGAYAVHIRREPEVMRRPHPILLSVPSVLLLAVLAWGCWHDRSNRYLCAAAFLCLGAFSIKGVVDELRDPIQVSLVDGSLVLRFSRDRHRTIKVTDIRRADERLGWYQSP